MLSVKNLHASVDGKEILRGIDLEVIDPAGTTLKRHRIDSRSADTAPDRRP